MVVRRTSVCLAKYSTKGAGAACGNVLCTIRIWDQLSDGAFPPTKMPVVPTA